MIKSNAIEDTPKYWFIFITKLLDTNIKKSLLSKNCLLRTNYFDAHRRFMQYSIERTTAFQKISSYLHVHVREATEKETEVEVPSGRIYAKKPGSSVFKLTSFPVGLNYKYYNHKWQFSRTCAIIDRYFLQVEKYQHTQLTQYFFNETSMDIYDGPGNLSPLLIGIKKTRNQTIYMTSTFQCIYSHFGVLGYQNNTNSHIELKKMTSYLIRLLC